LAASTQLAFPGSELRRSLLDVGRQVHFESFKQRKVLGAHSLREDALQMQYQIADCSTLPVWKTQAWQTLLKRALRRQFEAGCAAQGWHLDMATAEQAENAHWQLTMQIMAIEDEQRMCGQVDFEVEIASDGVAGSQWRLSGQA